MTNEELKKEAIKKCWGDKYEEVKDSLDENGGISISIITNDKHGGSSICSSYESNPKDLDFRTNNGWVRIEEDQSNLPKDYSQRYFLFNGAIITTPCYFTKDGWITNVSGIPFVLQNISHYRIIDLLKPIY